MNLGELVRRGALITAENVVRAGGWVKEISSSLIHRFGFEGRFGGNTVRALADRAQASVNAARRLSANRRLKDEEIPRVPGLPGCDKYYYRAIMEVDVQEGYPNTITRKTRIPVEITSGEMMSRAAVRREAERVMSEFPSPESKSGNIRIGTSTSGWEYRFVTIASVYRC